MSLHFTDSAATRVWELIREEGNPALSLRVSIKGGGCSGLRYEFEFTEAIQADDTVISNTVGTDTVRLLVDPLSIQYFSPTAEIDYKKDIEGEQFIVRNDNANTTCGCGSSFSVE